MKDEIRHELRRFAETTGIKGVARIVKTTSTVIRFFWLISIFACLVFLLYQLSKVLINYTSHTVTRSSKVVQTKPVFPDVTVCNLFPVYNISRDDYNDYLARLQTIIDYDLELKITTDPDLWTYMRSIEFYNANAPFLYDENLPNDDDGFVVQCQQYGWDLYLPKTCTTKAVLTTPLQKCHRIEFNSTNGSSVAAVTVLLFANNLQTEIIDGYNSWIRMSTGTGARVMIHPTGTYPNTKTAITVSAGNQLSIQLGQTNTSSLPQPYGDCTDRKLLVPSQPADSPVYSTEACISLCRQSQMIQKCGCLDNNEIFTVDDMNLVNCTFCVNVTQTINHQTPLNPLAAVTRRLEMIQCQTNFNVDVDACDCPIPCSDTTYDTSSSSAQWPNPLYHLSFYKQFIQNNADYGSKFSAYEEILKNSVNQTDEETVKQIKGLQLIEDNFLEVMILFPEENFQVFTDSAAITWDTLVANLGGSFNLWLGICVPTFAEIIELIYSLLVVVCCRRKPKAIEEVSDKSHDVGVTQLKH